MKKHIALSVFTSEFCGASFLWDIFLVALEARNLVFGSIPRAPFPDPAGLRPLAGGWAYAVKPTWQGWGTRA